MKIFNYGNDYARQIGLNKKVKDVSIKLEQKSKGTAPKVGGNEGIAEKTKQSATPKCKPKSKKQEKKEEEQKG